MHTFDMLPIVSNVDIYGSSMKTMYVVGLQHTRTFVRACQSIPFGLAYCIRIKCLHQEFAHNVDHWSQPLNWLASEGALPLFVSSVHPTIY